MRKVSLKNVTIIELLVAINRRFSDIIALRKKEGGKFKGISYVNLGRRTSDTAYNLKKMGVESGDRVAVLSESRPEWAIAFFGIVSCAGITVPMDIKLSDAEIEFILNDSGAQCIFVSEDFFERIKALMPRLAHLKNIVLLDDTPREGALLLKDFKVPETEVAHRQIQPDDTALIVYTSGTTGVAKGVELSYKNLLFEVMSIHELITFSPKDSFLSILPLNHMLEITGGFLGPLYAGGTITYCDSLKPTNLLALMQETRTTVMLCVPLVLKMFHNGIMKKIDDLPPFKRRMAKTMFTVSRFLLKFHIRIGKMLFASVHRQFGGRLRCFVSGGAPLDPTVELDFNAMGFRILQGYGLTETSPVITFNNFENSKYSSVGKPLPGIEVKILPNSESGGRDGEIITRGPHVMKGYYKNPDKTGEVLRDGWFYTGDIGYFDDDGFLFISGRIKNLIVLGAGKKVFPEEIEEVMSGSPYIKEICVLGRVAQKGLRKGCEEVYAVVVPHLEAFDKEQRADTQAVRKKIGSELFRLGENLAEYKRIMDFEVWHDELPKTSTRKVKRKVLLELISRKETREGAEKKEFIEASEAVEDDLTLRLRAIVAGLIKVAPEKVTAGANLYNDLAVDSLMKVEMLAAIHKELGIDIPDSLAYEMNTLADAARFCKEYKAGRSGDEAGLAQEIGAFASGHPGSKFSHAAAYFVFRALFGSYFRKSVRGLENLPAQRSFIIAANHSSLLDFPLILTSLPFRKIHEVFAPAARDYFYTTASRKLLIESLFNTFPFERMGDFMKGLKICEALIKAGRSIIIFPEGTRENEDALQSFKPGLGSLALHLNVPIVPVYIEGAGKAMPKGAKVPLPGRITVTFGKPIYPDRMDTGRCQSDYEKYTCIAAAVFNAVKELREN